MRNFSDVLFGSAVSGRYSPQWRVQADVSPGGEAPIYIGQDLSGRIQWN